MHSDFFCIPLPENGLKRLTIEISVFGKEYTFYGIDKGQLFISSQTQTMMFGRYECINIILKTFLEFLIRIQWNQHHFCFVANNTRKYSNNSLFGAFQMTCTHFSKLDTFQRFLFFPLKLNVQMIF